MSYSRENDKEPPSIVTLCFYHVGLDRATIDYDSDVLELEFEVEYGYEPTEMVGPYVFYQGGFYIENFELKTKPFYWGGQLYTMFNPVMMQFCDSLMYERRSKLLTVSQQRQGLCDAIEREVGNLSRFQ